MIIPVYTNMNFLITLIISYGTTKIINDLVRIQVIL